MRFRPRLATLDDLPALERLMDRAISRLQLAYLDEAQIIASHAIMGIDRQLIVDGTYWLVEYADRLVGCGGWSWRATLFGGDHSLDRREPRSLDPSREAARIRAMYTDPDFARRGVARLVLDVCERAALDAGFQSLMLVATLAGQPFYAACGYISEEAMSETAAGMSIPLVKMRKRLA